MNFINLSKEQLPAFWLCPKCKIVDQEKKVDIEAAIEKAVEAIVLVESAALEAVVIDDSKADMVEINEFSKKDKKKQKKSKIRE